MKLEHKIEVIIESWLKEVKKSPFEIAYKIKETLEKLGVEIENFQQAQTGSNYLEVIYKNKRINIRIADHGLMYPTADIDISPGQDADAPFEFDYGMVAILKKLNIAIPSGIKASISKKEKMKKRKEEEHLKAEKMRKSHAEKKYQEALKLVSKERIEKLKKAKEELRGKARKKTIYKIRQSIKQEILSKGGDPNLAAYL